MTDFLIIGGGIAGIAAAAELSRLGTVTLLEAEPALAYHTSGFSAAMFEESYGSAPVRALNAATGPGLAALDVLSPRGLLMLGTEATDAAFAADLDNMSMAEITVEEARARVPLIRPEVTRAAQRADARDIDTDRLVQCLARKARDSGAEIVLKTRAACLDRSRSGWTVRTDGETFAARRLVNAAGAWAEEVAKLAGLAPLGLVPHRRSVGRIPAPEGHDVTTWPMLFGPGEAWYAKPDAGALIVSPTEETPVEPHDAWAEDMALAEGMAAFEAHIDHQVTRLLSSWGGLRTFAPDRSLVIGPDPRDPAFLWSAGQGGYGFQTSLGAARLLADLVEGRAPGIDAASVAALRPDRLIF